MAKPRSAVRPLTLPLFDRLPRWNIRPRPAARSVPRICVPGYSTPFPIPPSPSPDDLLDATRLGQRLAALAAALDDLPRQARRFARWRAARDAAGAQNKEHRDAAAAQDKDHRDAISVQTAQPLPHRRRKPQRLWPLRPGRPPGWRRKPGHELHDILKDLHGLAFDVLERRDTS